MEKQLIIDTFNADREYLLGFIAKKHSASCKLSPKDYIKACMTELVSEAGIKLVEKEVAAFNGEFDADILAIVLEDSICKSVNMANRSELHSEMMVMSAQERQRNAFKGSWKQTNDPAPAYILHANL